MPSYDPATKGQAQTLLDGALDQLVSDGTAAYESSVDLFGATFTTSGAVDITNEVSTALGRIKGLPTTEIGSEFAFEFRIIQNHVYGRPTFGPAQKCWFDYGDSNPLFAGNPDPWFPAPLGAVTNSIPLGLVDGEPGAAIVEVPAIGLLAMTSSKLGAKFAENMNEAQLGDEATPAKVLVEIRGGRYMSMKYNVNEALDALISGGVEMPSVLDLLPTEAVRGATDADLAEVLTAYLNVTQEFAFDRGGEVTVAAPDSDELMDATEITSKDSPDPELCAAASS